MFGDQTSKHHAKSTDLKPALIPGMGLSQSFSDWNLQVGLVFRSERAKETSIFFEWNIWNPPKRLEQNDRMDQENHGKSTITTYKSLQLFYVLIRF